MNDRKSFLLKSVTTLLCVGIVVLRVFCPNINIDSVSIALLILALVPWFIQYIKMLEINGIGKIELVDRQKKAAMEQKAEDAGIESKSTPKNTSYSFYGLRYDDPKLALAGLRIEIEQKLRDIAEQNQLDVGYAGIKKMVDILGQHELIDPQARALILDITEILNQAVHSKLSEFDSDSFDWVFDLGLKILDSLEAEN